MRTLTLYASIYVKNGLDERKRNTVHILLRKYDNNAILWVVCIYFILTTYYGLENNTIFF